MTLLSCWLIVVLLIFNLYLEPPKYFFWVLQCMAIWLAFVCFACLFRECTCNDLGFNVISCSWFRYHEVEPFLLLFYRSFLAFIWGYIWVLLMLFVCPLCDLSLSISCAVTFNVWLVYMINITCHWFLTCGFWYLISIFHPYFCLTWCLFPFIGMFNFQHVHLLPPS